MVTATRLPFMRYANSCTLAKNVQGADDAKIDPALKTYEEYVVNLNKLLLQASQYYQREEYTKDEFKKGKELHKEIIAAFAKLDEQINTFGVAVADWQKGIGKVPDALDASGEITMSALNDARAITLLVLAKEPDAAAIKQALDKLTEQADKLDKEGQANAQAAFPKVAGPTLRAYIQAITDALAAIEKKDLGFDQLFIVATTMTALSEATNRALTRHLYASRGGGMGGPGGPGGPGGGPRPLPPGHPDMPARPEGPPPPPPADNPPPQQ
jgi:hypothetical protein